MWRVKKVVVLYRPKRNHVSPTRSHYSKSDLQMFQPQSRPEAAIKCQCTYRRQLWNNPEVPVRISGLPQLPYVGAA